MLIEEVYDVKEAGASDEKARAIATYEDRLADVRSTLKLHSRMLATVVALNVAILFRVFS